jgi:subtilisin family serine protease
MKTNLKYIILALVAAVTLPAQASKVAIVDSGTDFEHELLRGHEFVNPNEVAGNHLDDDKNGKVDDMVGWNFVDSYNRVFFRDQLPFYNPIVYPLITVIGHKQAGVNTADEDTFWEENVTKLTPIQKQNLGNHLNSFGQFAHSTHCSGIIAKQDPKAQLISLRVFPDQTPSDYVTDSTRELREGGIGDKVSGLAYAILAAATNGMFGQAGAYLNEQNVDVANHSLGVPLATFAKALLKMKGVKNPTPEQLSRETKMAFAKYEQYAIKWMQAAPRTLFVIAAGNEALDNDMYPTFPANVRVPNSITVAASLDYSILAPFSCYGKTTVDVAAPGVGIESTVPSLDRKMIVPMSGTSMAAPFVTGVAARIKELNPLLSPAEVKKILMGTVDKKDWLEGKVIASGVVNAERCAVAAANSRSMGVDAAITAARASVADVKTSATPEQVEKAKSYFEEREKKAKEAAEHKFISDFVF